MIKLPELDKNQIITIFIILGIITIVLTLIVFLSTHKEEKEEYIVPELSQTTDLSYSDFIIVKPELINLESEYYLIREQYGKWDWVQAAKYWINIKNILIDIISEENDKKMEDFVKSIP